MSDFSLANRTPGGAFTCIQNAAKSTVSGIPSDTATSLDNRRHWMASSRHIYDRQRRSFINLLHPGGTLSYVYPYVWAFSDGLKEVLF